MKSDQLIAEWMRNCRADPRSDAELLVTVRDCRGDHDDPRFWGAVEVLHGRFSLALLDEVRPWTQSPDPDVRSAGVTVLAQGHISCPEVKTPVGELLLALMQSEANASVLQSLAFALGHCCPPGHVSALVALANSEDADIRYAAVHSLCHADDPAAVKTLIRLSADPDTDVRDWATFALGSQTEQDTPELREALWARVNDVDSETRGEALVGLAKRKDDRVIGAIERELASPDVGRLAVEAAKEFPHRCFLAGLNRLKPDEWNMDLLQETIAVCQTADPKDPEFANPDAGTAAGRKAGDTHGSNS